MKDALENHLKGHIIPFGSLVEYYPISAKDQSRIHQFGKCLTWIVPWIRFVRVVNLEGCWCLQYTQPLTSHSSTIQFHAHNNNNNNKELALSHSHHPAWMGVSHRWVPVQTHSTPVLPKREEAVGCSTSPQPRTQWLSHNAARNSASMSTW